MPYYHRLVPAPSDATVLVCHVLPVVSLFLYLIFVLVPLGNCAVGYLGCFYQGKPVMTATPVLLLGCGIAEIPLNIFIGRINGRPACLSVRRKWERPTFFNNRCSLFFVCLFCFLLAVIPCIVRVTFLDWSAVHGSTSHCSYHRKSHQLSLWLDWL